MGADYLVHGTLNRIGERIRVVVQVMEVSAERLLWAETVDQDAGDILAVQDAVSQRVGLALAREFDLRQSITAPERRTDSSEGYRAYLKGHYFWSKRTPEGYRKAIAYFEQAGNQDPGYTAAKAGMAFCYNTLAVYNVNPPREAWPVAKAFAKQCPQADDKLAEAYVALVPATMAYDCDWRAAERLCQRALGLNSDYATAHDIHAEYLAAMGEIEESIAAVRRAQELDPLSLTINRDVGVMLWPGGMTKQSTSCRTRWNWTRTSVWHIGRWARPSNERAVGRKRSVN